MVILSRGFDAGVTADVANLSGAILAPGRNGQGTMPSFLHHEEVAAPRRGPPVELPAVLFQVVEELGVSERLHAGTTSNSMVPSASVSGARSRMISRYPSIASSRFSRSSGSVLPIDMHPGSSTTEAMYSPSTISYRAVSATGQERESPPINFGRREALGPWLEE